MNGNYPTELFLLKPAETSGVSRGCGESPETPDMQLVSAVLSKDRKATAEFVALHADGIYAYVRHRLIPRSDLVDDIVQDVFLSAWENLARFQGISSLRNWLLGIARHKVEDYYRTRLREPGVIEDEGTDPSPPTVVVPEFAENIDRQNQEKRVREVLESLPEICSLLLLWRYWEKRSTREIAVATGKSEKAVERLLARAREQFRRRWSNE